MVVKSATVARQPRRSGILVFLLGQIFLLAVYRSISYRLGEYPHPGSDDPRPCPGYQAVEPTPRARRVDRSNDLPHPCGMVFFYHVLTTGGSTINKWLLDYEKDGIARYFTFWGLNKEASGDEGTQKRFIEGNGREEGMNGFVRNFTSDEWRIAHAHHSSLHLNESEHLLSRWRSEVESQGCAFIASVTFREPLSHALALYKILGRYDTTRGEWAKYLETDSEMGYWWTQLDYFLYNNLARNPYGVDKETKVRRALELLRDHFDIVTVLDHDRFKRELLEMTGWRDKEMARTNTYKGELTFTKKEVEEMQKLLDKNGDTEFIRRVKEMHEDG